jgi:hypothetical protein
MMRRNRFVTGILKVFQWIFLTLTVGGITFLVWMNWSPTNLKDRALVIVVESNGNMAEEDVQFYQDNKYLADFVLTTFFGVPKSDLESKPILEVLDTSIDSGLAGMLSRFARGYGTIIALTGEQASIENFSKTLGELADKKLTTDLILFMHGNDNLMYFRSELIRASDLPVWIPKSNLGYVYQVNCYGKTNSEAWIKTGAKAVSGATGINAMVIMSPNLFVRSMVYGKNFQNAVSGAYEKEVYSWKAAKLFIPGVYWASDEYVNSSKPMFVGNVNYSLL